MINGRVEMSTMFFIADIAFITTVVDWPEIERLMEEWKYQLFFLFADTAFSGAANSADIRYDEHFLLNQ